MFLLWFLRAFFTIKTYQNYGPMGFVADWIPSILTVYFIQGMYRMNPGTGPRERRAPPPLGGLKRWVTMGDHQ